MAISLSKAAEKESQRSGLTSELAFNVCANHCLLGVLPLEARLSYFSAE